MSFPTLAIPHAADVTENQLELLIFSGALRPVDALPSERNLAVAMGISRTTLREALSRLQGKGLVQREGNTTRITEIVDVMLSQSKIDLTTLQPAAILDMMIYLMSALAESAVSRQTKIDQAAIREAALVAQSALSEASKNKFVDSVHHLFLLTAEAAHNFLGVQTLHVLLKTFRKAHLDAVEVIRKDPAAMTMAQAAIEQLINNAPHGASRLLTVLSLPASDQVLTLKISREAAKGSQLEAAAVIAAEIESGSYPVGSYLPDISELALRYGLAENAVRLALQILLARGLINIEKFGQARILSDRAAKPFASLAAAITRQPIAIAAVFEFRVILECWSARLAAAHVTESQKMKLLNMLNDMDPAVDNDPVAYSLADIRLHHQIAAAAGNAPLEALLMALSQLIGSVTQYWLSEHIEFRGTNKLIHDQHIAIVNAITAGDTNRAQAAMDAHLSYVTTTLRDVDDRRARSAVAQIRSRLRNS
ncbi:FadR/GntR family transcriptional regulator [Ahrensia sp. 13_GOM-1096m]|uniref:FadR/GntR family transcriptional regulator n=1 Tax=Ahrensia sp. 13_GOM-1096m TaxID=1380380 RepID=UPI00047A68D1|nr:GntR family transcriptional regulator [Ahrensia sp. 13_GOM-1096m]